MSSPARVLVVDDELIIADSLVTILKTRGYIARAAYCAEEALVLASEGTPKFLISDVMMPGMNGVELAVHFRQAYPECKVLLISGNMATAALLAESERQGHVHTILPNPLHPSELLRPLEGRHVAKASSGDSSIRRVCRRNLLGRGRIDRARTQAPTLSSRTWLSRAE